MQVNCRIRIRFLQYYPLPSHASVIMFGVVESYHTQCDKDWPSTVPHWALCTGLMTAAREAQWPASQRTCWWAREHVQCVVS